MSASLPNLLYVGDVPVESSYHGSALLHRLLEMYPRRQLRIVETGPGASLPERRLPGVEYRTWPLNGSRWLRTRFHRLARAKAAWDAHRAGNRVAAALEGFSPEAVLTVGHGVGWLAAAQIARGLRLPLHFIVHDDWPRCKPVSSLLAGWHDRQFGEVYRQARARYCVSPFMQDSYAARYGASGTVLYPSRASSAAAFSEPPGRPRQADRPVVFAFAGTLGTDDYRRLVRNLAEVLEPLNAEVVLFGPLSAEEAARTGLDRPNIRLGGLLSSNSLIERLRAEVDVLFVPMSFSAADKENMQISFPSKLTDYTAVGLPLLIVGPEYCSAVRWARENPSVAEIVTSDSLQAISNAAQRLMRSPAERVALGRAALSAGNRYFSASTAQDILRRGLMLDREAVHPVSESSAV